MNKTKNILIITATAIASSMLSLSIAGVCVVLYIVQPFQKEAVERGFASWEVTNTSNGNTEFRWGTEDIFTQLEQPLVSSMGCEL